MAMSRATTFVFLAALASAHARSQDLTPRAPLPADTVAIVGATIHPVSGPVIQRGAVAFRDGRITAVGDVEPGSGWTIVDGRGLHVYPGMIGAVTQLGLTEIAAVRASRDFTETGDVTPEVRAGVAVGSSRPASSRPAA
jgi:imidazolonepropionase-like amidohydrolase